VVLGRLARYRHFALFPAVYRLDRSPERTCVSFNDLRFAVVGRTMPFRYGSCRDGDERTVEDPLAYQR
jgi:inner membrane protein